MSQHGCPERLSNRSKGFQEDGPSQPTMEVLVETLTGTAFEMTVSPSDTIFAIKSKIFRVEGIPVSQQHILYNLKELDDASSLREHAISDGARLRLVLGMRVGPISTRRLPPPANAEPWRDIERLLDSNRDESEWCSGSGCRVTVVVLREGGRINLLRVRQNNDGTYSPLDNNKYSSSLTLAEQDLDEDVAGSVHENEVTMGKMMDLRRRMESLSVQRRRDRTGDKAEIQKTRSEETLSVPSLLDEQSEPFARTYAAYSEAEDTFAPLYDGNYTRYDYDCSLADTYTLLPPLDWSVNNLTHIGSRTDSDQSVQEAGDSERLQLSDGLLPAGSILVQGRRDRDEEAAILEELEPVPQCRLTDREPPRAANNLAPITAAEFGPLVCGEAPMGGAWRGAWGSSSQLPTARPPQPRARLPSAHTHTHSHSHSASSLHSLHALHSLHSLHSLHTLAAPLRPAATPRHPPLSDALFSSSTSDLEKLKRNSRILPALSRHRNREHLHLSDEGLDLTCCSAAPPPLPPQPPPPPPPPRSLEVGSERRLRRAALAQHDSGRGLRAAGGGGDAAPQPQPTPVPAVDDKQAAAATAAPPGEGSRGRTRCGWCRKRLSIATIHRCRCGRQFCAPHRYAEVHGCAYDYRARLPASPPPALHAPKLPKI